MFECMYYGCTAAGIEMVPSPSGDHFCDAHILEALSTARANLAWEITLIDQKLHDLSLDRPELVNSY